MRAEVTLEVRVRLEGVEGLDQAKGYARRLIEKGGEQEAKVGLPSGVTCERVECRPIIFLQIEDLPLHRLPWRPGEP